MTKEQFKTYICEQLESMDASELELFLTSFEEGEKEESIAEELVVIRGEFKKMTRLIHSMEQRYDAAELIRSRDQIAPLLTFDAFLKNAKDAIDSLPQASLLGISKTNRSIKAAQGGFDAAEMLYGEILSAAGIKRSAKEGDRFNPEQHEAVEVVSDSRFEDGIIIEVLEEGFLYRDEVIGYAKVKVNRWT